MRAVGCAIPLLVLLSVGCTPPGDGDVEYPDSVGRDPTAAQVCGQQRAWPDKTRFFTAEHVIRRFRAETGWALGRFGSIGIQGARTVLEVKSDMHAYHAYKDHFEFFQLDVIDPKCPALLRWLSAVGEPGPGGLIWENRGTWGGRCWAGAKRYPGTNLVVTWQQDCKQGVNHRWKRLDAVLERIVGD